MKFTIVCRSCGTSVIRDVSHEWSAGCGCQAPVIVRPYNPLQDGPTL